MSKYTFIKHRDPENKFSIAEITMKLEGVESLDLILEEFTGFLKAAGFCFDGEVGIIEEEEE